MTKHKLPPETELEIIATCHKTGKHYLIYKTLKEWENMKKKPNFVYKAYQKGYSSYEIEKVI